MARESTGDPIIGVGPNSNSPQSKKKATLSLAASQPPKCNGSWAAILTLGTKLGRRSREKKQ